MKISCIALNSNLIQSDEQTRIIKFLNTKLYEIGETFSLISYFDNSFEKIRNIFNENYDLLFFIGTTQSIYNHNIKENLSRIFGDKVSVLPTTHSHLSKYCEKNNILFSVSEECEELLPSQCIPLVSDKFYNNGFMYKFNNSYIVFLPENLEFAKENYYSYILPLINDLIGSKQEYQVIKCYGLLEKDLRAIIDEFFSLNDISINIKSDDLDNTIYIKYDVDCDMPRIQEIISNIVTKLNKFIYALEDVSIYQMAVDLLDVQKKTLSIAETITHGNITKELSNIIEKNILSSNIYLNFDRMIDELKLDKKVIEQYGKYSVNTVYELSNLLLEKTSSDIVLFVLGSKNESDLCYMAIGDLDGIHVYKNKLNYSSHTFSDSLTKTAIFYLIKKLKQNSLQFV